MKKILLFLIIPLFLFSCNKNTTSNQVPRLILRYADNQPKDYPTTKAAEYFAASVEERTDGQISIKVYPDAQLGEEKSVLEQIQFGGIDCSRFSLGTLSELIPILSVLQLPYLYNDSEHMWRVLDGKIGNELIEEIEKYDLTGLCWFDAGARSFYSRVPINSTKDLEGKTIRVQESELMSQMIELFNATSLQLAYDDVYSALKMEIIDGAENNFPSYISKEHYQVAPYIFLDEHFRLPEIVIMSKVAKEKILNLNPEFLDIIKDCAIESSLYERKLWAEAEINAELKAAEAGCVITIPDYDERMKLRMITNPIYEKFTGREKVLISEINMQ